MFVLIYGHIVIFFESVMKNISVVEAKAHFSTLLHQVELGEEIAITRHGKVIVHLVPAKPEQVAADIFREFWQESHDDTWLAPSDNVAEAVASLDD